MVRERESEGDGFIVSLFFFCCEVVVPFSPVFIAVLICRSLHCHADDILLVVETKGQKKKQIHLHVTQPPIFFLRCSNRRG